MKIKVSRQHNIPDPITVERFRRAPSLGPRILFFSGGSSLRDLSQQLIHYTHNSIHLITPFDSGGSSAVLRNEFNMIAVGDLRNRLIALADRSVYGNEDIYRLFTYRFPENAIQADLKLQLREMIEGVNELVRDIEGPLQSIICNHLQYFNEQMSDEFDLRGANIGNLILVGGYLNNNCNIEPALFLFERLAVVRGIVKPIVKVPLHLGAILKDGILIAGQHRLTGKICPPISSAVDRIFLFRNLDDPEPVSVEIENNISNLIAKADLIVYPMGSFFSSLLVNLKPIGVSKAIARQDCLKVFIPNTYADPEQYGMSFSDILTKLLDTLNPEQEYAVSQLINYIVVDTSNFLYPYDIDKEYVQKLEIGIIDTKLESVPGNQSIDSEALVSVLLSLSG